LQILAVHNRYLQRGGEDQSFEARVNLLRERGHHVDTLIEDNSRVARLGGARTAVRAVWSGEAYARLRQMLRSRSYDVLDVHNTFPLLSPAVYYAGRAEGVAVAQTLHNYRLACPKGTFFRDGQVCEDCLGKGVPWPAVMHACYRGSRSGSLAVVAMLASHRVLRTWQRAVDVYIAVSEFTRAKLVEAGLPAARVRVARNFVHPDPGPGQHEGGFALFVGRLAPEKGLDTLLAAWEHLGGRIPLRIVGDGPLAATVSAAAARLPNVTWLGFQPPYEVQRLMGQASALILPSEWYETFGLVAVEAYARGTPVIAADIGAVAEIVQHGHAGLCFPPRRATALADVVASAFADGGSELRQLGQRAREAYETTYSVERAYADLVHAYEQAVERAL
jgi:glycosyltransferase involved in cell wall biosynthesis